MSSEVLLAALRRLGPVDTLSHHPSALPTVGRQRIDGYEHREVGTQPFLVHGEAWLASRLGDWRRAGWDFGWAVNSRYAQILLTSRTPYAIWEATTLRDELNATSGRQLRRVGIGSGAGLLLHRAFLRLDERLERRLYRGARRLFAMSEYTRDLMIATHGLAPDAVELLPHPPSPAFLSALSRAEGETTSRQSRGGYGLALLFVGRADDPRKQFWLLADACALLMEQGFDFRLTVAGLVSSAWRGWLGAAPIAARVDVRGAVTIDELARLYVSSDVLVLPSRQEGFGIVVAEALHAGLPVVATRCGGPEFMIRESEGGLLVDHSADSLARAIATLADKAHRERFARNAREYATTRLSFETFADHVGRVTLDLIRGGA